MLLENIKWSVETSQKATKINKITQGKFQKNIDDLNPDLIKFRVKSIIENNLPESKEEKIDFLGNASLEEWQNNFLSTENIPPIGDFNIIVLDEYTKIVLTEQNLYKLNYVFGEMIKEIEKDINFFDDIADGLINELFGI